MKPKISLFQVGFSKRGKLFRHEVSCLERSAVDGAAPVVERSVRLCFQASPVRMALGGGRSCMEKSFL